LGGMPLKYSKRFPELGAGNTRAMSAGFATRAGRSRRFGRNPKPDFSGDFHPASREIKQERKST